MSREDVSAAVDVQYAARKPWAPSRNRIAGWIGATLGRRRRGELSVRIVGSAESRRLNRQYRGKDEPTNVLSFGMERGTVKKGPFSFSSARRTGSRKRRMAPFSQSPFPLGDLVICAPVVAREAREQGKSRDAHWAHMLVHGALHLLGYDHERGADAQRMERREIAILRRLGFSDPYVSHG